MVRDVWQRGSRTRDRLSSRMRDKDWRVRAVKDRDVLDGLIRAAPIPTLFPYTSLGRDRAPFLTRCRYPREGVVRAPFLTTAVTLGRGWFVPPS